MRVLITGATGFVGGYLAAELASAWPTALLFGTTHGQTSGAPQPSGLTLLPADLCVPEQVGAVVAAAQPDAVVHLAGLASGAGTDRAAIVAANVDATVGLLGALHTLRKPCQVLIASTGYVYGATALDHAATEDDPLAPAGAYAESKAQMEAAVIPLATEAIGLTLARAFNHTGPRQSTTFAVPAFAQQLVALERGGCEPVLRHGNLAAIRDFLDVRDVVRAYRLLLENPVASGSRIVNVASGIGVTMEALVERLCTHCSVAIRREVDTARLRPLDMPACVGDPARLKALTGWQPQFSLDDTLSAIWNWWMAQPSR